MIIDFEAMIIFLIGVVGMLISIVLSSSISKLQSKRTYPNHGGLCLRSPPPSPTLRSPMNRFKDEQIAMILTKPYRVEIRFKDMTSYLELTSDDCSNKNAIYYIGLGFHKTQLTNRPCGDIILIKKGDTTELTVDGHVFRGPGKVEVKIIERIKLP